MGVVWVERKKKGEGGVMVVGSQGRKGGGKNENESPTHSPRTFIQTDEQFRKTDRDLICRVCKEMGDGFVLGPGLKSSSGGRGRDRREA